MKHYIGIDFHKQFSAVAVMNEKGELMDERKLHHHNQQELINYFSAYPRDTSVALEATRNWYWLVDELQDLKLNVKLVHAKKARIIAESTIKTDKVDARILAHLDRCNFLPQAYIANKQTRSQRELFRYYVSLIKVQTSIKNRIHAILAKHNIHHGFSDLFGKAGLNFLKELKFSEIFQFKLNGYLRILERLESSVHEVKKLIRKTCSLSEYAKLIMTVPGLADLSALCLSAEIADIHRFDTSKKFCCYAGFASSTHQSADTFYHGHIIKDANKYIRYILLQAVGKAIRKDQKLWVFYQRIQRKHDKKKAKIATARKLAIVIYHMLKKNQPYSFNQKKNYSRANSYKLLGA